MSEQRKIIHDDNNGVSARAGIMCWWEVYIPMLALPRGKRTD